MTENEARKLKEGVEYLIDFYIAGCRAMNFSIEHCPVTHTDSLSPDSDGNSNISCLIGNEPTNQSQSYINLKKTKKQDRNFENSSVDEDAVDHKEKKDDKFCKRNAIRKLFEKKGQMTKAQVDSNALKYGIIEKLKKLYGDGYHEKLHNELHQMKHTGELSQIDKEDDTPYVPTKKLFNLLKKHKG
jgi:hypothetical protein